MLDVRRMRVLSEVAARGSFSAAADALSLTQSAVSQHVAALEREVGLALVERGTRPVELTEAGHALTRHATGIFARLDAAEQELGEIAGRRRGPAAVRQLPDGAGDARPARVRALPAPPPGGDADRRRRPPAAAAPAARARRARPRADLPPRGAPRTAAATAACCSRTSSASSCPRGHRLARRTRPLELAQLEAEPWIGGAPDSAWYRIASHHCRAAGFVPRVGVRVRRLRGRAGARRRRAGRLGDPRARGRPSRARGRGARAGGERARCARSAPPGPRDGYRGPAVTAMLECLTQAARALGG